MSIPDCRIWLHGRGAGFSVSERRDDHQPMTSEAISSSALEEPTLVLFVADVFSENHDTMFNGTEKSRLTRRSRRFRERAIRRRASDVRCKYSR